AVRSEDPEEAPDGSEVGAARVAARHRVRLLRDAVLLADGREGGERAVEMGLRVRGADLDAQPRLALRDDREAEAGDVAAGLEQVLRERDRERGVADDDRDDRVDAVVHREAELQEPVAEVPRVLALRRDQARVLLEDAERFDGG